MTRRKWIALGVLGAGMCLAALAAVGQALWLQAEDAKRDTWQRPNEVMDELGVHAESVVADVGAGRGYFTFRLAARVGPGGRVYAVEIDEGRVAEIRRKAEREGTRQIELIHGATDDPRLPAETLDAILVVNTYHEMREYEAMLRGMFRALKPGGLLGIIDEAAPQGRPRSVYHQNHELPKEMVREDAARIGFHYVREPLGFQTADGENWYFLIFSKPTS